MPNRKILSIFRKNNKQDEPEKGLRKKIKEQIAEPLTKEYIERIDFFRT
ncbi:MAG: hypothetical protein ACEY3D_06160 [Rickettsia sp.]